MTAPQRGKHRSEKTRVNLETGETGPLPENTTLKAIWKDYDGWLRLRFQESFTEGEAIGSAFGFQGYDVNGEEYGVTITMEQKEEGLKEGEKGTVVRVYSLKDYLYKEIWLKTQYSRKWIAKEEIVIDIK